MFYRIISRFLSTKIFLYYIELNSYMATKKQAIELLYTYEAAKDKLRSELPTILETFAKSLGGKEVHLCRTFRENDHRYVLRQGGVYRQHHSRRYVGGSWMTDHGKINNTPEGYELFTSLLDDKELDDVASRLEHLARAPVRC